MVKRGLMAMIVALILMGSVCYGREIIYTQVDRDMLIRVETKLEMESCLGAKERPGRIAL